MSTYDGSETALQVLRSRYLLKDDELKVVETPDELFKRVAVAITAAEGPPFLIADEFQEMMVSCDFLPNSPTLMNAGTDVGQLSACFVLEVGDSIESIFDAARRMAIIFKSGGGVGLTFSRLRPCGDLVASTQGISSGPLSFMEVFDVTAEVVKQGGRRRGAMMGSLSVHHPDVQSFIHAKRNEAKLTNMNTSVEVTDVFMKSLRRGVDCDVVNPRTGTKAGTLCAAEVMDQIVESAWATGEPGILFIDRINEDNPVPHLGRIEASNPCVVGDTWTMTEGGPRLVRDLVDRLTTLMVIGEPCGTSGFYKTGRKTVYLISTREGFSVEATKKHRFLRVQQLTRDKTVTEWASVSELKPGDRLLLMPHEPRPWGGTLDGDDGYLVGLWFGDGYMASGRAAVAWHREKPGGKGVRREVAKIAARVRTGRELGKWTPGALTYSMKLNYLTKVLFSLSVDAKKEITAQLERESYDFYLGFLRGFFDTDGSVQGTQSKGVSIRLPQSDLMRLEAVQRMLLRLGIMSKVYPFRRQAGMRRLPDGKGGYRMYWCKAQHELVVSGAAIKRFASLIGFGNFAKRNRLTKLLRAYKRKLNVMRCIVRVKSIESMGTKVVYDVQVPSVNLFEANGFMAHNCGELPLRYNESCNLGSINLANMVLNVKMDWEKLRKTVHLAVRFLDDVIDVNRLPFPEIKEETLKTRKIGLGVMGWAETLVKMGIPYDSDLALDTAGAVMEFINVEALNASRALACERGVYPEYRTHDKVRNATRTVVAPTGSISIIAGVTGGIEPMFSIGLKRGNILDGQEFYDVNPLFVELAERNGIWTDDLARRVSEVASIQDVAGIPDELKSLFKTAHDVSPERHVQMQAAFQRHVDNAVSKTVNLPADATRRDVRRVFMLANDLGCKGVTVYRDGCRANQPMTSGKKEPKKMIKLGLYLPGDDMVGEGSVDVGYRKPRKRPEVLDGKTIKLKTGCGNIFVTITFDESGNPMELFAKHGKAGVCSQVQCEAIGRLASLALRSQVDPAEVSKQLIGITCHEQQGLGSKRILSCADAIGKSLTKALNKSVVEEPALNGLATMGACPECGAALVHEGNCALCRACGYTKCS